ncbi:hypothetical protein ACFSND_32870 [Brevibacillus brevis]
MRYRKRNPDGSLGEWVYTPAGEEERQAGRGSTKRDGGLYEKRMQK